MFSRSGAAPGQAHAGRAGRGVAGGRRLAAAGLMPLVIVAVAVVSVLLTGFRFDVVNNAYHIPIVLGWVDDPAFAADPMVPTLHLFASPLYRLLAPVANEGNIEALFLLLMLAGRIATFWAFDRIGQALGIEGAAARTAFLLILVASIGLYNISPIGADGLLIPYFSHSELAQGIALLGVAAMLRGELTRAALLAGLTFAVNAFIGVWMLAPLGLVCLDRLVACRTKAALMEVLRAALAFTLVAAPVTIWILFAQAARPAPAGFNYSAFLADFFPWHFFIDASRPGERLLALAQLLSAAIAIFMLPRRRAAALILAGLVLVCAAGIAVGELSANRWLLNLHLMRSAGMIILVATPLVLAASFPAFAERRLATIAPATLVVLGVLTNQWLLVLPAMLGLLLASRLAGKSSLLHATWAAAPVLSGALIAATGATLATSNCCYGREPAWDGRSAPSDGELIGSAPTAPHWKEVQRWARQHTPADAMFLVPPHLDGFRTGARRPVWIAAKDGGAVPWEPALYSLWKARMAEVSALPGVRAQRRYACNRGIDYVVVDGRKPVPDFRDPAALFRNPYFAVFPACVKA